MNFLKNIFGGGGRSGNIDDQRGLYLYVRPKRCDQIVEVRIDLWNDLSEREGGGYLVRKVAQATRCPFAAELHLTFTEKRIVIDKGIENGEFVDETTYQAWLAEKA